MSPSGGCARFLRFAAVGAVGTLAHYALLLALVEGADAPPLAGAIAGFMLGALVNYALARRLVFASTRSHAQALPRFFAVALAASVLSGGWNFTLKPLAPDLTKFDPISGLGRVFSGQQLTQTLKACLLAVLRRSDATCPRASRPDQPR